jgi:hypothetical protein
VSILIDGVEMPQEKKITLTIFPDGRVYENHGERLWGNGKDCVPWNAVPVPPHGRLIDADALMAKDRQIYRSDGAAIGIRRCIELYEIDDAPTIIEAEEGET